MEILLSFILSVQVGLSVYAVMKYRELMLELQSKSYEMQAAQTELHDSLRDRNSLTTELDQVQKDIQLLKIKSTLGAK